MNNRDDLLKILNEKAEEDFRTFQQRIIPGCGEILGVRSPDLRMIAGQINASEYRNAFLDDVPHETLEENVMHAYIISEIRDFEEWKRRIAAFLPYVNNWEVCDVMSPKICRKHPEETRELIAGWLRDTHPYTVRFGAVLLMKYFLDDQFRTDDIDALKEIASDHYYVQMGIAWYLATALAKQYESTVPYIEAERFSVPVHNKAIQKAVESFRVSDEHKAYLKTLKRKKEC